VIFVVVTWGWRKKYIYGHLLKIPYKMFISLRFTKAVWNKFQYFNFSRLPLWAYENSHRHTPVRIRQIKLNWELHLNIYFYNDFFHASYIMCNAIIYVLYTDYPGGWGAQGVIWYGPQVQPGVMLKGCLNFKRSCWWDHLPQKDIICGF
jgi:hypothetical protein